MSADFDNGFGSPMERIASSGVIPDEAIAPATVTPGVPASLTAAEREMLFRQLREGGVPLPAAQPQ